MTMKITDDINNLREEDIYNIILFAIYKFSNLPEYSTLSELIYTIDKESLLKLCSVFGGCTIKIPTIAELKIFTAALLVYQIKKKSNKTFSEAFKETGLDPTYKKATALVYNTLGNIIDE